MNTNVTTKPSDSSTVIPLNQPRFQGARSPGKLILAGEHSVVYGAPALAVAVQHYTQVWFTPLHEVNGLRTAFESLTPSAFYPLEAMRDFATKLDERFDAFLREKLPVQSILQRPDDLAIYALTTLLPLLPVPGRTSKLGLPAPGQLSSRSDMPLGAGMGSSAAVVAATCVLYEHIMNVPQSPQERFEKVRFCERLQHGRGSAIDASAVVFGGLNRVQDNRVTPIEVDEGNMLRSGRWYWALGGIPTSKTGECVAQVRANHGHDTALWKEFETCSNAMEQAIREAGDPVPVLRENHRLLSRIGVVPATAQTFATEVEALGGAAKISGAGAVRGENAGVMLVYLPDPEAITSLMALYPSHRWEPLKISDPGAQLCHPPHSAPQ